MAQYNHHLKRLKHSETSFNSRSPLPDDETIRESIQKCPIKFSRPLEPGPQRARRGGGRGRDRRFHSSVSSRNRTIYYDLAESFMDHSTNPLSSDLYKIRFKHSAKQWPDGRFINYKEKFHQLDETVTDITCTRTFPLVQKRKKIQEIKSNTKSTTSSSSSTVLVDPIAQEQKKKLADKQTNIYANLFGGGKIPRLLTTSQIKKINGVDNSTKPSASNTLLVENKEE